MDDTERTEQATPAGAPPSTAAGPAPETPAGTAAAQDPVLVLLAAIVGELRLLRAHLAAGQRLPRCRRGDSTAGVGGDLGLIPLDRLGVPPDAVGVEGPR